MRRQSRASVGTTVEESDETAAAPTNRWTPVLRRELEQRPLPAP